MFRYLILGMLRNGAKLHGYALVKEYRERSGTEVSTGNFYRELQRLVVDGLIRGTTKPPDVDARRTPYEITGLGATTFDDWFAAYDPSQSSFSEDEISARALFIGRAGPTAATRVLERLRESLWFTGKKLERERQAALRRIDAGADFLSLPLLLSRRLKHIAADLEFLDELQSVCEQMATAESVRPSRRRDPAAPATAGRRS